MIKRKAAASFTEITLEEMARYLKRAFHSLKPSENVNRGEVVYDLNLSDRVAVRVYTSVHRGREQAADVGADAIRIQMVSTKLNRPLKTGKAPIVKRTQGWKDNLRERVEDEIESYYEKEGYWEGRAG
jgi:hypothetical protein